MESQRHGHFSSHLHSTKIITSSIMTYLIGIEANGANGEGLEMEEEFIILWEEFKDFLFFSLEFTEVCPYLIHKSYPFKIFN